MTIQYGRFQIIKSQFIIFQFFFCVKGQLIILIQNGRRILLIIFTTLSQRDPLNLCDSMRLPTSTPYMDKTRALLLLWTASYLAGRTLGPAGITTLFAGLGLGAAIHYSGLGHYMGTNWLAS